MIKAILPILEWLLTVYQLLVIVYVVLDFIKPHANRWTELLRSVVEPVLNPLRTWMLKTLPDRWMRIDWSPVALILVCSVLKILL